MFFFGGFFNKATAYTPGRILMQNTSNDVVPGKEVPFGGVDDYILYLDPETAISGTDFDWTLFFLRPKTALINMGILKYKLPLIA